MHKVWIPRLSPKIVRIPRVIDSRMLTKCHQTGVFNYLYSVVNGIEKTSGRRLNELDNMKSTPLCPC